MTMDAVENAIKLKTFEREGKWFISMDAPGMQREEIEFPDKETAAQALRGAF
jgi:hypothetical protein